MGFDAEIDPLTGDMRIPTRLVTGPALTLQRVRVRFQTFFGEVLLNRFVGLPFIEWRQQKPPDLVAIGSVLLAELAGTPGVIRVTDFDTTFDNVTRLIRVIGVAVIEDIDPANETAVAFAVSIGAGNTTPAVISFHPTSGRIAGV